MENPIKMEDLGVPPFSETSIYMIANIEAKGKKVDFYLLQSWKKKSSETQTKQQYNLQYLNQSNK